MKKGKLSLKKITVSNLSEDFAKRVFGGDPDPMETYGGNCTVSCTADGCVCTATADNCGSMAGCASGPESPGCTGVAGGCTAGQCATDNGTCFTQHECSYAQCTGGNCPATYMDKSCANGPATCSC